jgi:hypothetical protein
MKIKPNGVIARIMNFPHNARSVRSSLSTNGCNL